MPSIPKVKNNEQVYDEQIYPLVEQIDNICSKYEIPFALQFIYKYDEENRSGYACSTCQSFGNPQINRVVHAMLNKPPTISDMIDAALKS